jgi:hypothetical protein
VKNSAKALFLKNTPLTITKQTGGERVVLRLNFMQKQHTLNIPLTTAATAMA